MPVARASAGTIGSSRRVGRNDAKGPSCGPLLSGIRPTCSGQRGCLPLECPQRPEGHTGSGRRDSRRLGSVSAGDAVRGHPGRQQALVEEKTGHHPLRKGQQNCQRHGGGCRSHPRVVGGAPAAVTEEPRSAGHCGVPRGLASGYSASRFCSASGFCSRSRRFFLISSNFSLMTRSASARVFPAVLRGSI